MENETQEQIEARILTYIQHPEFRHVSRRQHGLCFYKRDADSPTGCMLIGACLDTPENNSFVEKHRRICAGGQMGNGAPRY